MRATRLGTIPLLLLGTALSPWAVPGPAAAVSKTVAVATAELDADPLCVGCEDLVVGDRRGRVVNVFFGHGDGTFAAPVMLPVDAAVLAVATGDCDGDGDIDVLASTVSPSRALTVFVNGAQQGSPKTFLRSAGSPIALHAGGPTVLVTRDGSGQPLDVNGDGLLDLVVIEHGKHLAVLLGDGNCGFTPPPGSLLDGKLTATAAADFDGVNGVDLVATDRRAQTVFFFFNNGSGGFPTRVEENTIDPTAVVTVDVNGDALPDVVTTRGKNAGAPMVFGLDRFLNLGNKTFSAANGYAAGGRRPAAAVAGLFTADALPDVVVANQLDNVLALVPGGGFGNFDPPTTSPTGGIKPVALAPADFDRDGVLDVAVANATSGGVTICHGDGTGFACTPITSLIGP